MKRSAKFAVTSALIGLVAGAWLNPGPASAGVPPLPDLSIKEPGGVFVGDGVYGGAGQVADFVIGFNQTAVFKVRIQQDTTLSAPITIEGAKGTTHFGVKYFKGQQNISKAVRNGTFTTPPLTVGQKKTIRVHLTAKTTTNIGQGFFVRGTTPAGAQDTVLAEIINCGC